MRTPFTGVGTALVTPFTQERRSRRSGGAAAGAPSDRRRHPLPRAVRHDRRESDADAAPSAAASSRSSPTKPRRRCRCSPARAATTRRKSSTLAARAAEGRRDGLPVGDAVLQQADAGRSVPALPRDRRQHAAADRALQRAGPHRRQHRARDARAPRGDPEHRRREGSVGQHAADVRDLPRRAARLHRALRRRCDDAAADGGRRPRRHFGGVERDAARDGADGRSGRARTTSPRRARFTPASCR